MGCAGCESLGNPGCASLGRAVSGAKASAPLIRPGAKASVNPLVGWAVSGAKASALLTCRVRQPRLKSRVREPRVGPGATGGGRTRIAWRGQVVFRVCRDFQGLLGREMLPIFLRGGVGGIRLSRDNQWGMKTLLKLSLTLVRLYEIT